MSILPQNGGFHCSTGASALCGGPPLLSVTLWPAPKEPIAAAKFSIFDLALPEPDADSVPHLALNFSAIIFTPLPGTHRKILLVRLARYTAKIVTRDIATGNGGVRRGGSFRQQGKGSSMPEAITASLEAAVTRTAETALERITAARSSLETVIFGQTGVVEQALITLLSGGHGLLVGVPGLAKTKLVETLGVVLGLQTRRVQFTPDLMPADILGSEVLEETVDRRRSFRFVRGPIFAQLLMADEINRASPRTQSALLQAMQEYHVSVAGERHDLPRPFHVLATQNPLEQEGTYPLPEAQLDRFLMQIDVVYPDRAAERRILIETTGDASAAPKSAMSAEDLIATQRLVRRLPIGESVVEAILDVVRLARPGEGDPAVTQHIAWGPGPRAAQALMLATRARALLGGQLSPSLADVVALAVPVLKHRMALTFAARAEGETVSDLVARLANRLA
jgi:MoxR-like ATPase